MRSLLSVLILCLVLVGFASAQLTWSGTWISTCNSTFSNSRNCYGGYLTLCTSGTNIYGTYSNLGQINGTTAGRTATGTWKEAGFTDNNSGGFYWQLNSDTDQIKFSGYYWYDSEPCVNITWNGRLFDPQVDETKCLPIESTTVPSIDGHWQAGVLNAGIDDLWICVSDDKAHFSASSFINPQGYQTYAYGRVFYDDGKVAQGSAFYQFGDQFYDAITYYILTGPDTLVTLNYQVDAVEDADLSYDTTAKEQITWTRVGRSSQDQCVAYRSLANINWEGVWTDTEGGGKFYTCVIDGVNGTKQVSGVYSEYGYVIGDLSEDGLNFIGNFSDSGNDGLTGTFNLTISDDGFSFSGYYSYADTPETLVAWNEQRLDVTDNYSSYCWLESTSLLFNASGSWLVDYYNNYLDLCINGTSVFASYEYGNESTPGYIEGTTQNGDSLQVTLYEETSTSLGIIRYTSEGLQLSVFNIPVVSPVYQPCVGNQQNANFGHEVGVLERSVYSVGDCKRNAYIKTGVFPVSSSASTILFSIFALVICLIL